MRAPTVAVLVLTTLVAATAVGVIYAKHQTRRLFVELQTLERSRDRLNVEWGRLRLEEGSWATHGRVEAAARDALDMAMPGPADVVVVRLPQQPSKGSPAR